MDVTLLSSHHNLKTMPRDKNKIEKQSGASPALIYIYQETGHRFRKALEELVWLSC